MLTTFSQGFRKYLSHAKDHEELLAFILGQMVKDKVRQHQLMTGTQPSRVTVTTEALEARVCTCSPVMAISDPFEGKGSRSIRCCTVLSFQAVLYKWL